MKTFKKGEQITEGKAKIMYTTDDPEVLWVHSKDQATALNGKKKVAIANKGYYTNHISSLLFNYLNGQGVPTHFISLESDTDVVVKRLKMIPLEVVVRNFASGHFVTRFAVKNMMKLDPPVQEFYYKSDELDDPMINNSQILALKIVDEDQIKFIQAQALKINEDLKALFNRIKIDLVDIKFEFGITSDGQLILGDELSPDNMRLVDQATGKSLDKDVFRKETGNLIDGYAVVLNRLKQELGE
ncbi:phosphoribosylaminoimidazolesuccinocarboxamide synthase [Fructilactobacillus sanfranciscensis]|uniref:phosphoribosylaminoimidazolesuccinocarboxamide synthase n=1 Tax=Fructilactobacillus sanfranciscensis TaxID=1625 RepID=UPI00375698A0